MCIREELLNLGYSNDYIDKQVTRAYENVVEMLPQRKRFCDTRIGQLLFTNWEEFFINKVALYYYKKERARHKKDYEFTGDKTNPIEVYEYHAMHGIMPDETIPNEDGSFTHKYGDITVTVKPSLTGVISDDFLKEYEIWERRLLADFLNMEEEMIINMTQEEIEALVYEREFGKKFHLKIKRFF